MARHDRRSKGHDMTREKPILFSAPMVRAILDGSKTQTRRVVKLKSHHTIEERDDGKPWPWMYDGDRDADHWLPCPYGQPGDRLRVKEAAWMWCERLPNGKTPTGRDKWHYVPMREAPIHYAADHPAMPKVDVVSPDTGNRWGWRYKVGRFLPAWASRITLEVTGVRVERLQDISEADAKAEGCDRLDDDEPGYIHRDEPDWKLCPRCGGTRLYTAFGSNGGALPDTDCEECNTYVKRYRRLWESINGVGSWDANPWVWVVEFRRIAQ